MCSFLNQVIFFFLFTCSVLHDEGFALVPFLFFHTTRGQPSHCLVSFTFHQMERISPLRWFSFHGMRRVFPPCSFSFSLRDNERAIVLPLFLSCDKWISPHLSCNERAVPSSSQYFIHLHNISSTLHNISFTFTSLWFFLLTQ